MLTDYQKILLEILQSDKESFKDFIPQDYLKFNLLSLPLKKQVSFLNSTTLSLKVLGFGEISTVVEIQDLKNKLKNNFVYKKLPVFNNYPDIKQYKKVFFGYLKLLKDLKINLPLQELKIVKNKNFIVFVKQEKLNTESIGNKLIHKLPKNKCLFFIEEIFVQLLKIYNFNISQEKIKIGIDGQISNWALENNKIFYLDITSPLYRINNIEQINPEIFLKSSPLPLRILIKKFFLQDVLDRYYNFRLIIIDLIANFFKEDKKELIKPTIKLANNFIIKNINEELKKINYKEVKDYYKLDAFIWKFFQFSRKVDKFIITKIFKKKYDILLPEKIKR